MDANAALDALTHVTASMAAAVREADLRAPVPSCPGWDVTKLVDHLGRVHLWAEAAARTGQEPDPYPRRDREQPLPRWYAGCAATLVSTLSGLQPDHPAWTFSASGHDTGFWRRRQFHETAVHRVDLGQATGEVGLKGVDRLEWVTADQAADGIDEVLTVMAPRKLVRLAGRPATELIPAERPVAFSAADVGRSWTLRLVDGAVAVSQGIDADAAAAISGSALHLYLGLWGRIDQGVLRFDGDEQAARGLLDASLVP